MNRFLRVSGGVSKGEDFRSLVMPFSPRERRCFYSASPNNVAY